MLNINDTVAEIRATGDLKRPYCICGRRVYSIGFQDGSFPDYGWHTKGEMGGIWMQPIKLADGLWVSVDTEDVEKHNWITNADEFVLGNGGAWVECRYDRPEFEVVRHEFVPHDEPAMGFEIKVTSKKSELKKVYLSVLVRFDMIPAWFSSWPDPQKLKAEQKGNMVVVQAELNNTVQPEYSSWTVALISNIKPSEVAIGENIFGPERTAGNGISAILKFPLDLQPDGSVRLVIGGDLSNPNKAEEVVTRVMANYDSFYKEKMDWYNHIATNLTNVDTPEPVLNDAWFWSKMSLDWMTTTSPILGTGVVAGYQDFPWYFGGDTDVSIPGMLMAGLHEQAKAALLIFAPIGKVSRGRIPHELIPNGSIYSHGHIMETTLWVKAIWETYMWTGDDKFLKELYPICIDGMLDYVLSQPSRDGFILMEYEDLPNSKRDKTCPAYIISGLDALGKMAVRLGDAETAKKCAFENAKFRSQVEDFFWSEEFGVYATFIDDDNKPLLRDDRGWPAGTFCAPASVAYAMAGDASRVNRALDYLERPEYNSDWGLYLSWNKDCLMPITHGQAAIGEFNYNRLEQGMRYVRDIAKTTHHFMPGALPEYTTPDGDPTKFDPIWCFCQLWSAANLTEGMMWGLLHIEPDAARKTVTITPRLPKGWDRMEFTNIIVGDTRFNVKVEGGTTTVTSVSGPELDITVKE